MNGKKERVALIIIKNGYLRNETGNNTRLNKKRNEQKEYNRFWMLTCLQYCNE